MSEGFAKDRSVSMEGVCLSIQPNNSSKHIIFYSHLSHNQNHDHQAVVSNISLMLNDMFERNDLSKNEQTCRSC